jgi:hypothetical protein
MILAVGDNLVDHATIFEMSVESYHSKAAIQRRAKPPASARQSPKMTDCCATTI